MENNENKEKEETPTKTEATPTEDDGFEKTNTPVDDTNLAAKRLEEATKEAREERLKSEENYAKMKLGGVTEGRKPAEKKEETPHEYRVRIEKEMAGGKTEFGN